MKPTKPILIGDVLSGSEAAVLRSLVSSFPEPDTLFFANFHVDQQQIDFFVVTPTHAGLIELKHFTGPVFGEINGAWELIDAAGNRVPHSGSSNPYNQALKQTYALSDAMKTYRKRARVPDAEAGRYFRNFKTYVAIAPKIQPNSRVTSGDNKARILSADEVIERIRTTGHTSTWSVADWYAFAINHLHLRPVTLEEAIDPQTLEAANTVERYRERAKSLIGTNLPPLLEAAAPDRLYGATLVKRLQDAANVLLVGPSGSAKTFHLHHAAIEMFASDDELPILVEAKRYRGGDFWPFLRACLAPVFPGDPKHLIGATTITGVRPALLIDALNECAPALHDELLKGAIAFALQYDARTILTAHEPLTIAGLTVETVDLPLPSALQKREIYAFHARVDASQELDAFCGGFRNAYELTIAGRCHGATRPPMTTLELYDRYVAACLPSRSPAIAGGLARHLAAEMGERGSLHLTRNDCETAASRFLAQHGAPLTVLDDLLQSRLLDASGGVVTFEHELLSKYLRSSALQRSVESIADLCAALRLPRHRDLVESILPRLGSRDEVDAVLNVCDDVSVLTKAYDGVFGPLARTAVVDACDAYARRAIAELETLDVHFESSLTDDGRCMLAGMELRGASDLSSFETIIAQLISTQNHDVTGRARLLTIIDRSESALGLTVRRRAQEKGIGPRQAWSELLRLYVGWMRSMQQPRSILVLSNLKHRLSGWPQQPLDSGLRASLLSRALGDPVGTFALYLVLEDVEARRDDGEQLFTLVERAWETRVHYLRMSALFALTNARTVIDAAGSAVQERVADFLTKIEASDWILSSMIVEAQSRFETIDAPIPPDDALTEMRATIDWSLPAELRAHFGDKGQNEMAYALLSRIFEDVFQGAYYDAYQQLADDERLQILCLASGAPHMGFSSSWIMHELRNLDRVEALPVFRKAATAIDLSSPFPQDEIAVFVTAIYGFSRYAEAPPLRHAPTTLLESAWFAIADALFWAFRDGGRCAATRGSQLLTALDDDVILAAAAALSELHSSHWQIAMEEKALPTIAGVYPDETRRIAIVALSRREEIRALYRRFGRDSVLEYVVKTLGEMGDGAAIPTLRAAMNDASIGEAAIKAIQDIEARSIEAMTGRGDRADCQQGRCDWIRHCHCRRPVHDQ